MKTFKGFIFVCLIIMATLLCGTLMSSADVSKIALADGIQNPPSDADYTDCDVLYGLSGNDSYKVITDYLAHRYANSITISSNNLSICGDDDVVRIIPKQYFVSNGSHAYIGKEYGYYIYTFTDEGYGENNHGVLQKNYTATTNKHSIVFVFDLKHITTINGGIASNTSIKIEPLFQREYVYLTSSNNESYVMSKSAAMSDIVAGKFSHELYTLQLNYSLNNISDAVVPLPRLSNGTYSYVESDLFFLNNIKVGVAFENELHLNYGDDFGTQGVYNAATDDGCYISGTSVKYKAFEYSSGSINSNQLYESISSGLTSLILGCLSDVGGVIGTIATIEQMAQAYVAYATPSVVYSSNTGKHDFTFYDTTRAMQVLNYGQLMKSAMISLDSSSGSQIWLGTKEVNNQRGLLISFLILETVRISMHLGIHV